MSDVDALQRRKAQIIAAVFGVGLVFGVLLVMLYPELANPATAPGAVQAFQKDALSLLFQVAALVLCFTWLGIDSRQLGIRRPWWLNVGIVLLPWAFVPYYLYKTRPQGQRGSAILSFFGIVFGCMVAMMIGMYAALLTTGVPAAAPPKF